MRRLGSAILCGLLLAALSYASAAAKARLIAVFPLRSTPALASEAMAASRAIVGRLSQIEGYDAQLVPEPKSGSLGAAAAAAGAEVYVVGQIVATEGGYKITVGSFSAATDQPINRYTVSLASADTLPDQPDVKTLIVAAAAAPSAAPAPAPRPHALVLIPYEEPGSTDPFEIGASQTLVSGLSAAGITAIKVAPTDALEAVANAAKLCTDNGVSGILVPDGRFQQTMKPGFMSVTIRTHVDLRLDDVGCDGAVRWSTTAGADDSVSGLSPNVAQSLANAYTAAAQQAAAARGAASIPKTPPSVPGPVPQSSTGSAVSTYVLVPFDVLGMAPQRSADMTHALLIRVQARKLDVKIAAPIDRLTAVARASELCSTNGAQAIIVPGVRMEMPSATGNPFASLRLSLLSCSGGVIGHAAAKGTFKPAILWVRDPDGAVAAAADDASEAAITRLFPNAPK